jgi:hypothetical protein
MLDTDSSMFLFNCNLQLDCEALINNIKDTKGKEVLPDKKLWSERNAGYSELFSLWEDGNVNLSSAKWSNYYPGKDYDENINKICEELLNVKIARAWISRVDPGYCTPWHWDTDDNEQHYLKLGKLKRFVCHIGKPEFGHVFLLGKEAHYFWDQGDMWEWNNYHAWHAGFNCGVKPKFMLHILAYE